MVNLKQVILHFSQNVNLAFYFIDKPKMSFFERFIAIDWFGIIEYIIQNIKITRKVTTKHILVF